MAASKQAASASVQFGVHALVWEGGWTQPEAERAIAGTKAAGYDLIEGKSRHNRSCHHESKRLIFARHPLNQTLRVQSQR